MLDFNEIFNDSYERIHKNPEPFYDAFYTNFMATSAEIRQTFGKTNLENQKLILQDSLIHLTSFFVTNKASQYLVNLAETHQTKLKIDNAWYDDWVDAMIATIKSHDPKFDHLVEVAWRVVLAPGIEFMKHY